MPARWREWVERRSAPVSATIVMVVAVMAISLLSQRVVNVARLDLWSLATSSSAIVHGHFSQIYVRHSALTSPPAFELALAPVVAFGRLLGLAPHVHGGGQALSQWFVLGPATLLMASTALFALDAVARLWRLSERSRLALALVGALGVADVTAGWGHPEDCVAVALVVWAALAMERLGNAGARRAALLLGVGIAFQPLALIGVVPVLARLPWPAALRVVPRLVLPSIAVLVLPLLAEPQRTLFVLVHQPFEPRAVSVTPLTHLAPVIGPGLDGGGPTRLVAVVAAASLALLVCRRRPELPTVLGLCAVGFFLRILLETELNWYYLWPIPALCLLLALRRGLARFWLCAGALVASIVLGRHAVHSLLPWWPAFVATAVLMLLCAAPPPGDWLVPLRARLHAAHATVRPVEFGSMVEPVGTTQSRE